MRSLAFASIVLLATSPVFARSNERLCPPNKQADDIPAWCGTTTAKDPGEARQTCLIALNAAIVHLREKR